MLLQNLLKLYFVLQKTQNLLLTLQLKRLYYFSKLSDDKLIKIFTVGSSTKKLALELGYKNVIDCNGDSVKMFKVVIENTIKEKWKLIYVGAKTYRWICLEC